MAEIEVRAFEKLFREKKSFNVVLMEEARMRDPAVNEQAIIVRFNKVESFACRR